MQMRARRRTKGWCMERGLGERKEHRENLIEGAKLSTVAAGGRPD